MQSRGDGWYLDLPLQGEERVRIHYCPFCGSSLSEKKKKVTIHWCNWYSPIEGHGLLVRAHYNQQWIRELKSRIPASGRRWWPQLKSWFVHQKYQADVLTMHQDMRWSDRVCPTCSSITGACGVWEGLKEKSKAAGLGCPESDWQDYKQEQERQRERARQRQEARDRAKEPRNRAHQQHERAYYRTDWSEFRRPEYGPGSSRGYYSRTGMGTWEAARVLGISWPTDTTSVKRAYRKRALETHPDHGGNEEMFKEVNRAKQVLDTALGVS